MKTITKTIISKIIELNKWYDNIKEPTRSVVVLIILITLISSQLFFNVKTWATIMFIIVSLRMTPTIYKLITLYKNTK